jgi:DivIVA domain-containing protein
MERQTSLLAKTALTPEGVRHASFPTQMFGGYQQDAVHRFATRVAREIAELLKALDDRGVEREQMVRKIDELGQALQAAGPAPLPDEHQAVRILQAAQANSDTVMNDARMRADQLVSGARHQHDQLLEHASQQAGAMLSEASARADAIVAEATSRAEKEHASIVDAAPAEARRQVDYYAALAKSVADGLRGELESILQQLSDWERRAREGAPRSPTGPQPAMG